MNKNVRYFFRLKNNLEENILMKNLFLKMFNMTHADIRNLNMDEKIIIDFMELFFLKKYKKYVQRPFIYPFFEAQFLRGICGFSIPETTILEIKENWEKFKLDFLKT